MIRAVTPLLLLLLLALPAEAIRCRQWVRLQPTQKQATVARMIQDLATNNQVRQLSVNTLRLQRCLQDQAYLIVEDFDYACSQGRSQGMNELDRIFKSYAWSCISPPPGTLR